MRAIAGWIAAGALSVCLAIGLIAFGSPVLGTETETSPTSPDLGERVKHSPDVPQNPADRTGNPGPPGPVVTPTDSTVFECPPCDALDSLRVENFSNPRRIDNPWMPLVPGTQTVFQGVANRGGGLLDHTVVFTVTNVVKVIEGIECVAVWDRDINQGDLKEEELAFFAQDNSGNVWLMGEYPEEYESGVLLGAENTWIYGIEWAEAGIIIPRHNAVGDAGFLQAYAPENDFWDCGQVEDAPPEGADELPGEPDSVVCVPAVCSDDWLFIKEWSPLEGCEAIQTKMYVEGYGVVEVGAIDDPEGETLKLMQVNHLSQAELDAANAAAMALDTRGYTVKPELYGFTVPAFIAPPPGNTALSLLGLDDASESRDRIVRFSDLATGAGSRIATLGSSNIEAFTVQNPGGVDERLFAVANDRLVKIDPSTGACTVIGGIGHSGVSGLAFHPSTGTLYGVTRGSNRLLRIDPNTGAGTVVARDVLEGYRPEDIAFHPDGRAFVLTGPTPRVFQISLSSGAKLHKWTLTGGTSLQSLVWSPDGSTLYSAAERGQYEDLVRIDLATATIKFVGAQRSGGGDIEALAWVSPATEQLLAGAMPEPALKAGAAPDLTTLRIGPNPVRSGAEIVYSLAQSGQVQLDIYDVAGRRVRSLANHTAAPGMYQVQWDRRDAGGRDVAAGVYYLRLRTPASDTAKTIVVSK